MFKPKSRREEGPARDSPAPQSGSQPVSDSKPAGEGSVFNRLGSLVIIPFSM